MTILEMIWDSNTDCAYAESTMVGAWVEKSKDPVIERWIWTVDTLDDCMSDDQEDCLIGFGIENTKIGAILAAEAAARAICPA